MQLNHCYLGDCHASMRQMLEDGTRQMGMEFIA